jgi:hypothetical protein
LCDLPPSIPEKNNEVMVIPKEKEKERHTQKHDQKKRREGGGVTIFKIK